MSTLIEIALWRLTAVIVLCALYRHVRWKRLAERQQQQQANQQRLMKHVAACYRVVRFVTT